MLILINLVKENCYLLTWIISIYVQLNVENDHATSMPFWLVENLLCIAPLNTTRKETKFILNISLSLFFVTR